MRKLISFPFGALGIFILSLIIFEKIDIYRFTSISSVLRTTIILMKYEHTAIAMKDQRKVIPINSIHIPVIDAGLFVVASCTDTRTIIIRKARKYVKKTAKIEIISLSHAISFFSDFKRWQFPRLPRQYGFSVS
ncbi:hypothetical protein [Thermoplasma acidophilum]|uniref:Uncharacterized protein n=2 Tax=Thermoplasmatales TaxID=2301 RepID=Q9HL61_THEAC|nr:hypothetical protein [Thermoplasma acidophilum]